MRYWLISSMCCLLVSHFAHWSDYEWFISSCVFTFVLKDWDLL